MFYMRMFFHKFMSSAIIIYNYYYIYLYLYLYLYIKIFDYSEPAANIKTVLPPGCLSTN
jgi:hypothetical protein